MLRTQHALYTPSTVRIYHPDILYVFSDAHIYPSVAELVIAGIFDGISSASIDVRGLPQVILLDDNVFL